MIPSHDPEAPIASLSTSTCTPWPIISSPTSPSPHLSPRGSCDARDIAYNWLTGKSKFTRLFLFSFALALILTRLSLILSPLSTSPLISFSLLLSFLLALLFSLSLTLLHTLTLIITLAHALTFTLTLITYSSLSLSFSSLTLYAPLLLPITPRHQSYQLFTESYAIPGAVQS